MKIGILGYGEIGQALAKFYKNPLIKDLDRDNFVKNMDIMHVAIPYNEKFIKTVMAVRKKYRPKLVIVHSTVQVGTCQKLKAVHSPVRGLHPHLYKGIKTFVKYIGYDDLKQGRVVLNHFNKIGIKGKLVKGSRNTELGKLLDTTYYGVCIEFHRYANELCKKYKADFETVMTDFNTTYNEGYKKLGKKNVIRPTLYPPKGKIGGHCIGPNYKILGKKFTLNI